MEYSILPLVVGFLKHLILEPNVQMETVVVVKTDQVQVLNVVKILDQIIILKCVGLLFL